ncbi:MAG TPA: ABC transporter permease [Gemmataceae bacterium]|nr:ABC transporter permease [Gemmataceae bacterium]
MANETRGPKATGAGAPSPRPFFRLPALSGPVIGLVVVLAMFIALLWVHGGLGTFLSLGNAQVLVHDNTIAAVVALGMLLVMISGGIDLSVGSVVALVTVVTMWVFRFVYAGPAAVPQLHDGGWHWPGTHSVELASAAAVTAGVATGGLCGLFNGTMVTALRLPSFVATLGLFSIARGLAFWLSERTPLSFPRGVRPGWVNALAETSPPYGVFYPGFWSLVVLAVAVACLLRFTVLGRYCYAIGSNEATARLCGVPIARSKLAIYTLAGLLTGWAGVLSFAHVGSGDPSGNVGLELIVIAAVVIGGASLNGGQGTVLGALIGVLILGILDNGVTAFNVPVEVKYILIGAIIIANTALAQWQRREGE